MEDLPPPSYDDAIIGDYSAPSQPTAPPLSSPERYEGGYEETETPWYTDVLETIDSIPAPSILPEIELTPLSPGLDQQDSVENDQISTSGSSKDSCPKRCMIVTWKLLIIGGLVGLLAIFYLTFISPSVTKYASKDTTTTTARPIYDLNDCITSPPLMSGASWTSCRGNYEGYYDEYVRCPFKCDQDYTIPRLETENLSLFYVCRGSKWYPQNFDDQTDRCVQRSSGPDDCKNDPPININEGYYSNCPRNRLGQFYNGSKCSFGCKDGHVIANQKQVIDPASIDQYKKDGVFLCIRGRWISSDNQTHEEDWPLECKLTPPKPGSCMKKPPSVTRAKYTNTQCDFLAYNVGTSRPNEYFNGTKCSFRCTGDHILSSSEDQRFTHGKPKYDKKGAYTCVDSKWVSSVDKTNEKLECLTITEFVIRNIG